jgi:hypothetical protein
MRAGLRNTGSLFHRAAVTACFAMKILSSRRKCSVFFGMNCSASAETSRHAKTGTPRQQWADLLLATGSMKSSICDTDCSLTFYPVSWVCLQGRPVSGHHGSIFPNRSHSNLSLASA